MKYFVTLLAVFFFSAELAAASDLGFVETQEDMVNILKQKPQEQPRTRGLTRGFSPTPERRTRAIRVKVKDEYGGEKMAEVQEPLDPAGATVRMKIEFDVNSAAIRPSAFATLANLGQALRDPEVAGKRICIKGHTDSDGSGEYNLQLSYSRAYAVLDFLKAQPGVRTDSLVVMGYGESNPLMPNDSYYNKQINRRVEISTVCPAAY